MTQDLDPYAVLGVPPGSSAKAIRKAYHALARAAHPDLVGDGGLAMMQRLNAAWAILRDPGRRAAHDATRPAWRAVPRTDGGSPSSPGGSSPAGSPPSTAGQRGGGPPSEPAWTGAAGAPPGRPSGSRLTFGLYAGWTIGEIARRDPGYLAWLSEHKDGRPYAEEILKVLEALRPVAADSGSKGRGWRGR